MDPGERDVFGFLRWLFCLPREGQRHTTNSLHQFKVPTGIVDNARLPCRKTDSYFVRWTRIAFFFVGTGHMLDRSLFLDVFGPQTPASSWIDKIVQSTQELYTGKRAGELVKHRDRLSASSRTPGGL